MSTIAERLDDVRTRIARAVASAGRDPDSVRLVAVSKGHPADGVREAYRAGQRLFGENYAQELVAKAAALGDLSDLSWHMIGHLQSNKARQVVPIVTLLHTVDSLHLAEQVARRADKLGQKLDVLLEVNVAKDPDKSGCSPSEIAGLLVGMGRLGSIRVRGLMTMPPYCDDPREARRFFGVLRALQSLHGGAAVLPELSMGMSHDFEQAIAEGATLVRVGTSIFGPRTPRNTPGPAKQNDDEA